MSIVAYTDGSSRGNPGPGGFGVILSAGKHYKEVSQGYKYTTNNRMELMSVIVALEMLKNPGSEITIYSDSRYVVDAIEKRWVYNWQKKGFAGKKNPDLWQRFLKVYSKHKVKMIWVKGHAGNPMNERCDQLAVAAATGGNLADDTGYNPESDKLFDS